MSNNIWFTSDNHYFHVRMSTQWRPFSSVEEMNEIMIERHNQLVAPGDVIYNLGDFSFGNQSQTNEVISRLQGQIHMIWGNHDYKRTRQLADRFVATHDYHEMKVPHIEHQKIVLFHYPILSWHGVGSGAWHLHGHCHNNLPEDPEMARMDVGVDTHDFYPWHIDEIAERLKDRHGVPGDHHNH